MLPTACAYAHNLRNTEWYITDQPVLSWDPELTFLVTDSGVGLTEANYRDRGKRNHTVPVQHA